MKSQTVFRLAIAAARGIFLMSLVISPLVVTAAIYRDKTSTTQYGGLGGQSYTLECNQSAGEVMIGVSGRYGMWLDAIRARCREVTIDGTLMGTTRLSEWRGNQNGGTQSFTRMCPTNHVVSGIVVRYGSYVHGIRLVCS